MKRLYCILLLLIPFCSFSQQKGVFEFTALDSLTGEKLSYSTIAIENTTASGTTNDQGIFTTDSLAYGTYKITFVAFGYEALYKTIVLKSPKKVVLLKGSPEAQKVGDVVVKIQKDHLDHKMNMVDKMIITHSKKSEVIDMDDVDGNKAASPGRQVYNKIAGLNIWESDGAGIQLGIGGRGLDPSRTSSFNTRQNGYDISADALGYPESYYTPTLDAVKKIQMIRGAASLQFGTQFGGLLNFVMKEGHKKKKAELVYKQTKGSFGFDNFFASVGGTVKSVNYYVYGNYKNGDDWRPNSAFDVYSAGGNVTKMIGKKTSLKLEFTKMYYLTQQAGGLTDAQFNSDPSVSHRDRNWFKVDWNLAALSLDHEFKNKSKLNSKLFGLYASRQALGFLGQINRIDPLQERTLISGQYKNWGNETRWLNTYEVNKQLWSGLVGFRFYKGYSESRQGDASSSSEADFNFVHEQTDGSLYVFPSTNISLFGEHIFQITKKWGFTPGVRYEHINTKAEGEYRNVVQDLAGNVIFDSLYSDVRNNSRNIVIAGIGTNLQYHKNHRVYANFSQNYRSINFTDMQIQNPNFKIDPDLEDEKGFNVDLGFQGSKKGLLYYDVSFFLLSYNNRIGTTIEVDPTWYNTYQYRTNISASLTKGVEAMVEYDVWKALSGDSSNYSMRVFTNVSFLDAKYINSKEAAFEGKNVELVPPFTLKTGVKCTYKDFTASYQFSYTHEHYSDATNSESQGNAVNGLIPSYYISDLGLKYKFKMLQLETGVNNVLNQYYFTRRASGYPGPGIIPSSPRNYYVSLQITL